MVCCLILKAAPENNFVYVVEFVFRRRINIRCTSLNHFIGAPTSSLGVARRRSKTTQRPLAALSDPRTDCFVVRHSVDWHLWIARWRAETESEKTGRNYVAELAVRLPVRPIKFFEELSFQRDPSWVHVDQPAIGMFRIMALFDRSLSAAMYFAESLNSTNIVLALFSTSAAFSPSLR